MVVERGVMSPEMIGRGGGGRELEDDVPEDLDC